MHHQELSGDHQAPPAPGPGSGPGPAPGGRKSAYHLRRGSSGASAGGSTGTADTENPQAGSSSPAPHHPQGPGAQIKKKSGFQITSVTSAQINVSGNNSLADDTESYDDMDESHTEDLSSSDIIDVSVGPRATDIGALERSSSDETLNSLHGVETPALVSPNEHVLTHINQMSLVNGTVNPHTALHQSVPSGDAAGASAGAPLASSSPNMLSTVGVSNAQRTPLLDTKAADVEQQSSVASVPAAEVQASETGAPSSHSQQPQAAPGSHSQPQAQAAPGSRFRVVKLDTNSEPFRKGRWMCTEFYEKELPHSVSETSKGLDASAETEAPAPHPLQVPQGPPQPSPLPYVPVQDAHMGVHMHTASQPAPLLQRPYTVDPQQSAAPYPSVLSTGAPATRQPDFIQPTAPFQSQVQPPLPHAPLTAGGGLPLTLSAQPSVSFTQQLTHIQGVPPPRTAFSTVQTVNSPALSVQLQPQFPLHVPVAATPAPPPGAPMPLTALQADLQPLLAPSAHMSLAPGPGRSSQLEDAHRLLFQHQGLLGLPRLGPSTGGAEAAVAHMSAEASAFMAAAAGLRGQQADGEDDSSSGASVVAIDNKIEQAMDLVKSHLMYAVREEVEVLKEQIKELIERNSLLEQENTLLKTLASPEQMAQFQAQVQSGSPSGPGQPAVGSAGTQAALPPSQNSSMSA